eukprot:12614095-Ditylum_brightwellii.AAC.1
MDDVGSLEGEDEGTVNTVGLLEGEAEGTVDDVGLLEGEAVGSLEGEGVELGKSSSVSALGVLIMVDVCIIMGLIVVKTDV